MEGTTAAARLIVCGCEHTANNRTDAEHAEEVPADEKTFRVSCLSPVDGRLESGNR